MRVTVPDTAGAFEAIVAAAVGKAVVPGQRGRGTQVRISPQRCRHASITTFKCRTPTATTLLVSGTVGPGCRARHGLAASPAASGKDREVQILQIPS
jgi:hypothetical protein